MSTRVSADAATRVVTLVSESLNAEQDPKTWNEIVELTADTSIRRNVKPARYSERRRRAERSRSTTPALFRSWRNCSV